jgi:single stranded DNA-binding protein
VLACPTPAASAHQPRRLLSRGRREQEASFFTVVVWRDQAEHAAESLSKGSRVVVVGRLQQRSWTAEEGSARSVVEVVAEELGPTQGRPCGRPPVAAVLGRQATGMPSSSHERATFVPVLRTNR